MSYFKYYHSRCKPFPSKINIWPRISSLLLVHASGDVFCCQLTVNVPVKLLTQPRYRMSKLTGHIRLNFAINYHISVLTILGFYKHQISNILRHLSKYNCFIPYLIRFPFISTIISWHCNLFKRYISKGTLYL